MGEGDRRGGARGARRGDGAGRQLDRLHPHLPREGCAAGDRQRHPGRAPGGGRGRRASSRGRPAVRSRRWSRSSTRSSTRASRSPRSSRTRSSIPQNALDNVVKALKVAGKTLSQVLGAARSLDRGHLAAVVRDGAADRRVDRDHPRSGARGRGRRARDRGQHPAPAARVVPEDDGAGDRRGEDRLRQHARLRPIYFASESLVNDIIFGIQDFFNRTRSRGRSSPTRSSTSTSTRESSGTR